MKPFGNAVQTAFPKSLIFFLLKFNMVGMFWIVLMCWYQKWFLKNKKTSLACISAWKVIWKAIVTTLSNIQCKRVRRVLFFFREPVFLCYFLYDGSQKWRATVLLEKGIKERTYLWGNICINWHKEKEKGPGRDLGGKQMRTKQIPCLLLCLVIWIAYLPLNCHPLCTNFRPTLYSGKQLLLI